MRLFLPILIVLLALAGGVLWFTGQSRGPRAPAPPRSAETSAATEPPRSVELAGAPAVAPARPEPSAQVPPQAPQAATREAAATTLESELARARWVEGRVVFPPGTPADEEVHVVADGRDFADGSDHRARVAPDGSFRVAFSEKTRAGQLELDARYLFLEKRVSWKHGEDALELRPELGARIEGRLHLLPGIAGDIGGALELLREDDHAWIDGDSVSVPETLVFAFDALDPSHHHLVVYDGASLVGASGSLELERGRTVALELELRAGVVLSGVVRDEDGAPLAGARVEADASTGSGFDPRFWGRPDRQRVATSAADGAFRVGALFPGRIRLQASLAGFAQVSRDLGKLETGVALADLVLVLPRGQTIAGTVRWPDGSPAEAYLELSPYRTGTRHDPDLIEVTGKTDAAGSFAISGLSDGTYRVLARATRTEEVKFQSELTGRERTRKQRTSWTAEAGEVKAGTRGLALTLSTGMEVAGRVVDDRGAALSDFLVRAERVEVAGEPSGDDLGKIFRDTDGGFVLAGFTPGTWELRATSAGHAASLAARVTVPGSEPVLLVAPREAIVRGIVLDARGAPASDAFVSALQEVASQRFGGADEHGTDASGAFEIDGLRPGTVRLQARGNGGAPNEPLAIELAAGETRADVVLHLRPGARIVGELVDADGRPASGRAVWVHSGGFTESPETDDAGRFELADVPPGQFDLVAETREGMRVQQRVTVAEGATVHVRLAPSTTGRIVRLHGRVRAAGEPLASANLYARGDGGGASSTSSSAVTDAEGAYELTLPGPGEYALSIHTIDGGRESTISWSTRVDVSDVPELEHDVSIPLGRISGRVLDPDDRPLARIPVRSTPERHEGAAHGSAQALSDDEGRYELLVPAGRHAVRAGGGHRGRSAEGAAYAEARIADLVVAENGELRGIDLHLGAGGSVEGRVLLADGTGAPLARVWAAQDGVTRASIACDESGRFRIDGLAPGTHLVSAWGRSDGGSSEPVGVAVEAGASVEVELALQPSTLVHVLVRDASGAQVGCEIALTDDQGRALPVRSGKNGEAWLGPLVAGRYTVRAVREGKSAEKAFELAGVREQLELELAFE